MSGNEQSPQSRQEYSGSFASCSSVCPSPVNFFDFSMLLYSERPSLKPNHEVRSTVWVPLHWMLNPASRVPYTFEHEKFRGTFSAFRFDRYTIWGLTYRILENFVGLLGREFPGIPPYQM